MKIKEKSLGEDEGYERFIEKKRGRDESCLGRAYSEHGTISHFTLIRRVCRFGSLDALGTLSNDLIRLRSRNRSQTARKSSRLYMST